MDTASGWTISSYLTSTLAFFAGLSFERYLALGGFIMIVATFLLNRHYKKKDEVRKAAHEKRLAEKHEWERRAADVRMIGKEIGKAYEQNYDRRSTDPKRAKQ